MSLPMANPWTTSTSALQTFFMASDYEFLPDGERAFKNAFDRAVNREGVFAKIEYKDSGHFFKIICAEEDFEQVLKITRGLYADLIDTECGDDYNIFESSLIAKLPPLPEEPSDESDSTASRVASSDDLILLNFRSLWQCETLNRRMDRVVPRHVQLAIELITHTKLFEDLDNQIIEVHAHFEEDCNKVIHKLEVLRKYHDLARRQTNHLFFTEDRLNYEMSIKYLPDVKNKLVETTLLDPTFPPCKYDALARTCTFRCCPYLPIRCTYIMKSIERLIPAVPKKAKHMAFDLWSGYLYPGIGDETLKHGRSRIVRPPPVGSQETADNIRSWLATEIPDDSSEAEEHVEVDIQRAEGDRISSSARSENSDSYGIHALSGGNENKQTIIDMLARKLLEPANNKVATLLPATEIREVLNIPHSRRSIYRSPGMQDLRIGSGSNPEKAWSSEDFQSLMGNDVQENEQSNVPRVVVTTTSKSMKIFPAHSAGNEYTLEAFLNPSNSQSLLDTEIPENDIRGMESTGHCEAFFSGAPGTPYTPLPTRREETGMKAQASHQTLNKGASTDIKGKCRALDSPPAAKFDNRKRSVPLIPSKSVKFADLDPKTSKGFGDEMKDFALTLLSSFRNYYGEVSLKCHFGRILVEAFGSPVMRMVSRGRTLPAQDARGILLKNPDNVKFSKIITTLPADIKFLLNMKIEETDQRIWGDVAELAVTYEYTCCDHGDYTGECVTGFIIEMNTDSFETKVKSAPFEFGNINVHCTMRNWDYLITAVGSRSFEAEYGDLAQAIKESTHIVPGSEEVSMSFELSPEYQIHFQSIRVRRDSQYRSHDKKTLLNITEVHDLDMVWEKGENGNMFFVTSSKKPNSVWYEMNLESVEAKVAFMENLDLELAEEAEWTAEWLLHSGVLVEDICVPANYIVTKMDGVGYYNENGNRPGPTDLEKEQEKKRREMIW